MKSDFQLEPQSLKSKNTSPKIIPGWLIISTLFVLLAIISFTVTTEDAYISFRYAENIADGHGLVFNVGEDVVEGYSNPTWVALLAITGIWGVNVVNAGRCLGLLFGVLTLLEMILLFRVIGRDRAGYGLMATLVVATAPMYLFWSQTGLENGLFIYLIVLGMRLAMLEETDDNRFPYSAIPYFLLAVTRPEGIMYFVIIGAWKIVAIGKKDREKAIKRLALWASMVLAPFIIFLIWRYATFGAWVPNTFFAKVNNGVRANLKSGSRYLIGFLNHSLWIPLIIPVLLGIFAKRESHAGESGRALLAIVMQAAVLVTFILYVGGDIHPYDRFGVPIIIFSAIGSFILASRFGSESIPWWKRISTWTVAVFILANLAYSFPPAYGITPPMNRPPNFLTANIAGLVTGRKTPGEIIDRFRNPPVDALEFVGRDLHDNPDINGLLAAEQCGKIPYFYDQPVLDLLGLNDREIADIVHSISSWDIYTKDILSHAPENFVMVYRNGHLISRYYIENTVLSLPFRNRYSLDAIYHVDYYFRDIPGSEHTFNLELVRYRAIPDNFDSPLTEEEEAWFEEWKGHDISRENPDLYSEGVEEFRMMYRDDEDRIIRYRVDIN